MNIFYIRSVADAVWMNCFGYNLGFLLKKVVRDKIQESTLTTIAHSELESSMCNYNTAKWAQPNGRGNIEH